MIFYRGAWSQLWLQLATDEPLGILDTDYLEDYDGQDGQISLLHVQSGIRRPVLMAPVPADSLVNFRGFALMSALPDGQYSIQGRVRDLIGNLTILGAVASPIGGERHLDLSFQLKVGKDLTPVMHLGPLHLLGGVGGFLHFPAGRDTLSFPSRQLRVQPHYEEGFATFPPTKATLAPLVI